MTLSTGARLGPYEIVALLGAGGMGAVYRARDARLGREVAVKVLPDELAGDPDRLRRFENEARAVAALSHPNILAIYDVGAHEAIPYLVTELLDGETLRERLDRGALRPRAATEMALQIAQGLAAAHHSGIVHRDLKPENVFLTRDGRVKLLDFGLAKPNERSAPGSEKTVSAPLTLPGTVMGTVGYMSPEQVRGEPTDARGDIFSFGAVLYEMLSGRRAFQRGSAAETMAAILKEEPPEVDAAIAGLPPGVDRLLRHCLEKAPDLRFQSASDLAFALQALGAPSGSSGVVSVRPARGGGRVWRAVALAAIPVAAVAGYLAHRPAPPSQPSFAPLTFHRGYIRMARFAPDGQTVAFGALWEGRPMQVHTGRTDTRVSQPLDPVGADLLAVSSRAEIAVGLDRTFPLPWVPTGTLARMPMLGGGAPREVAENVLDADFSPDGGDLAVSRQVGNGFRLEYPAGKALYENAGYISDVRFSPRGDLIAFMDHPVFGDDRGTVGVVDRSGAHRTLTPDYATEQGLAWSPDGREVWFTATESDEEMSLHAVDLSGHVRLLLRSFQRLKLQDVGRDGQLLITTEDIESDIRGGTIGQGDGPNLASFKWATARDLSADGRWAAINEFNAGNLSAYQIFLRGVDGAAPISLGLGAVIGLTADGRSVVSTMSGVAGDLRLIPVGAGEARSLVGENLVFTSGRPFPTGSRVMVVASDARRAVRTYVVDTAAGAPPRPITDEGVVGRLVSPDGTAILASAPDRSYLVVPVEGGQPRKVAGLTAQDRVVQWLADGHVLAFRPGRPTANIERVDVGSGTREPWLDLVPRDPSGVLSIAQVYSTRDGRRYLYEVRHVSSGLFAVTGVR